MLKKGLLFVFLEKYFFLFINIYFVPLDVISLRYNTLVPELFPILEALRIYICMYYRITINIISDI